MLLYHSTKGLKFKMNKKLMQDSNLSDQLYRVSNFRDQYAFSKVFDFFAPKINAYFIKNNIDSAQSEELTQEVMSMIWLKANQYNKEKSKLSTWIFSIARNKKIDFFRKHIKNKVNEDDLRDFLYNNSANDYEIELTINKIREELDTNQQNIIKMSFFEQKSHKKIAEELEIPLGTVKSRIRATLSKMQKHIL